MSRGDRLLSIEAMKMETGVFAERDGVVEEVLVAAGTQVDTKQLLMVVGDGGGDGAGPGRTATRADLAGASGTIRAEREPEGER